MHTNMQTKEPRIRKTTRFGGASHVIHICVCSISVSHVRIVSSAKKIRHHSCSKAASFTLLSLQSTPWTPHEERHQPTATITLSWSWFKKKKGRGCHKNPTSEVKTLSQNAFFPFSKHAKQQQKKRMKENRKNSKKLCITSFRSIALLKLKQYEERKQ